jgi:signal transduction histidine kinase/DNA-binding NarL/FixJ family response regulator
MAASPEPTREYRVAEEQAALRRVAVLVARAAPPGEVFAAVTEEAGRLLGVDHAMLSRYDPGGAVSVMASWSSVGADAPVGTQMSVGDRNLHTQGAPVTVAGRLWGVMTVASTRVPLPVGTEAQLAGFTELAATAIASAQARTELRSFAEEQAALRRVSMSVARAAPPEQVFTLIAEETGQLIPDADFALVGRYNADRAVEVVGGWDRTGRRGLVSLQASLGGTDVSSLVFDRNQPVRIDRLPGESGGIASAAHEEEGVRCYVGAPISVEGWPWGVMIVASTREGVLPEGAEQRLAGFAELAATAITNAEAQAALAASRARIVAAADQTRRRIERDLHDGAQQRLVSLALQLRAAQAAAPPGSEELAGWLEGAIREATGALEELREIARGLHPALLTESGLHPALRALARRSAVPVDLDVRVAGRLPEEIEVSGYYVVAEALTNAAKHARASGVSVEVEVAGDALRVVVRDDGTGGADLTPGAGLVGLKDRVEAQGGRFLLDSPHGAGTSVRVEFPLATTNAGAVRLRGAPPRRESASRGSDDLRCARAIIVRVTDGRTRVVVADDDVLLREGLASLLERADFDVAGQAGDAPQLVALIRELRPELVIVDIRMPPGYSTEGLDAAREIRAQFPDTAILVLSAHVEVEHAMDLLASGQRSGYLLKSRVVNVDDFIETLRRVVRGGSVVDPELVKELVSARRVSDPLDVLSSREREVLALMAEGRSNSGIARELWVTEGTVEKHVRSILMKLRLPEADDVHRRVLAVLTFLGAQ